jgi:hypothetical protein
MAQFRKRAHRRVMTRRPAKARDLRTGFIKCDTCDLGCRGVAVSRLCRSRGADPNGNLLGRRRQNRTGADRDRANAMRSAFYGEHPRHRCQSASDRDPSYCRI